jgi:superfamily II DNA or RNA helicase
LVFEWSKKQAKKAAGGTAGALYQIAYKTGIVENGTRNAMIVRDALQMRDEGRKTVVPAQREQHDDIPRRMMEEAGLWPKWVFGGNEADERGQAPGNLRAGVINPLISSTILDEIPSRSRWPFQAASSANRCSGSASSRATTDPARAR